MKVRASELSGVLLVEPEVFPDQRGFLLEAFNAVDYANAAKDHGAGAGPAPDWTKLIHITHSRSTLNTVRGLHFQLPRPQGKLVWVVRGRILDVALDIRRGSPSFGKWTAHELDDESHRRMWIPEGFAHGFCVLSDVADVMYACTDHYVGANQHAVRWNDAAIGIDWPVDAPVISDKDAAAPLLADVSVLPDYKRT
mgnify:CR=1 FL=1